MLICVFNLLIIVRIKPFQADLADRLNVFSQVTQMIMLYNGMFYITGSGKWYMDPSTGIDWLFLFIIFVPSIAFLFSWLNAIKN